MRRPTEDDVRAYLGTATFPAERATLVADAMEAGAPDGLVQNLQALPGDHLFQSVAEVTSALRPSRQQRIE
jgi:hypothetical protein